jgi:hypothetical protein
MAYNIPERHVEDTLHTLKARRRQTKHNLYARTGHLRDNHITDKFGQSFMEREETRNSSLGSERRIGITSDE